MSDGTIPIDPADPVDSVAPLEASGPGGSRWPGLATALVTGGIDRPYVYGLVKALGASKVAVEVLVNRELEIPELARLETVRFRRMYADNRRRRGAARKLLAYLAYYREILLYTVFARPRIFHVLWNYKLQLFDQTVLMLWFRLFARKVVLTAHNVNIAARDGGRSRLREGALRLQYRLSDHIFVHTERMKQQLVSDFGVREQAVTVIPFGVNNAVPVTGLTSAEARRRLGVGSAEKAILFFGRIREYKGLHHLVEALDQLLRADPGYRLIIAGEPKKESMEYWRGIERFIAERGIGGRIVAEVRFIEDAETELYFKAADLLVLPYTGVFQSGVLFLSWSFGLPVVATDVGSLRDEIITGRTGFLARPSDSGDLARSIEEYFSSELYRSLEQARDQIRDHVRERNSWDTVAAMTCGVYGRLLHPAPDVGRVSSKI